MHSNCKINRKQQTKEGQLNKNQNSRANAEEKSVSERKTGFTGKDHTFVICAYKENKNLEKAVKSLMAQTVKSNIIISTSTPNMYIFSVATKYDIQVFIRNEESAIAKDWNFGYMQAETALITIVHQDDIYEPDYLENVLRAVNKNPDMLICFTDYYEIRNGKKVMNNKLLIIKRIMLLPMLLKCARRSKFIRRRILSFGNPICCPSVTFNRVNAGDNIFDENYKNSCDYKTWVVMSKMDGSFIYIPDALMGHRIYEGSETTKNIKENIRTKEDLEIFRSFWPDKIADFICRFYSESEKSNQLTN